MRSSNILTTVEALERQLLEPSVRASRVHLNALIADDFTEFGHSGRMWNKAEIVSSLLQSPALDFDVDNFQSREIGNDVVLVTYNTRRKDEKLKAATFRSSIWHRNSNTWRIVFHQASRRNQ